MLTWPQNAENPISKDHNYKLKGTAFRASVSPTRFSKIQYLPKQTTLNHFVSLINTTLLREQLACLTAQCICKLSLQIVGTHERPRREKHNAQPSAYD